MKNYTSKLLLVVGLLISGAASADIVKKTSVHSVKETMDKFEELVKSKGMSVFARINHKENAVSVDMKMNDAEVLIFGNPKGGTVLMKKDIAVSLDLPLRVAVYKDQTGKVWLSYHNPQDLKDSYDVAGVAVLNKVEGALDKLTTAVTK
jgi:uncharacterized protein (DUF302 family)